jgi:hypothetical protein
MKVVGSVVIDGERAERDVEVETFFLSLLKGRARTFAPFCTFFFREVALPERDDLTEEATEDFGMVKRQPELTVAKT